MQIVIKHFPASALHDECSGIANLESNTVPTARTPLVVAMIIVAGAFSLGAAAGALITLAFFKF